MTKPKAILFDLDDTLAVSKQPVTPHMAIQFMKLLTIMPVGIVSGAKPDQIKHQFVAGLPKEANLHNLYLFPEGAAECFAWNGNEFETKYSHVFSPDEAKEVISVLNQTLEETKIVAGETIYGDIVENRGGQITLSALGQIAPVEAKRPWDPDQSKRQMLRAKIAPLLPFCEVKIGGMTSVDISKKGIDKRLSVLWIKDMLGCDLSELIYVGDALFEGGNDAIIKETGVPTIQTKGPEETYEIIGRFL